MRARPQGLMARRITEAGPIPLADGRTVSAQPGDYRLFRGALTLDVLSPARYAAEYEPVPVGGLTLTGTQLDTLAEMLGLTGTLDAAALLRAIDRLASIRIGDVRIPFTAGQLDELQHRAQKRGRSIDAELRAVVTRIEHELFYAGG